MRVSHSGGGRGDRVSLKMNSTGKDLASLHYLHGRKRKAPWAPLDGQGCACRCRCRCRSSRRKVETDVHSANSTYGRIQQVRLALTCPGFLPYLRHSKMRPGTARCPSNGLLTLAVAAAVGFRWLVAVVVRAGKSKQTQEKGTPRLREGAPKSPFW